MIVRRVGDVGSMVLDPKVRALAVVEVVALEEVALVVEAVVDNGGSMLWPGEVMAPLVN